MHKTLHRPLGVTAALGWALTLALPAIADEPIRIVAGPMFTPTFGQKSMTVWLQLSKSVPLDFRIQYTNRNVSDVERMTYGSTVWKGREPVDAQRSIYLHYYPIKPDKPGETALLTVSYFDAGGGHKLLDALPVPRHPNIGQRGRYIIAFGSCSHQEKFGETQPIWEAVVRRKPDCFLFIGDNIYLPSKADEYPAARTDVMKLYCDTYDRQRRTPELQPLLRSAMTFAIWDDHDYGPNNADRTWKWKDVALKAMKLYFPNDYGLPMTRDGRSPPIAGRSELPGSGRVMGLPDAPGCFYRFAWGDVDVFMLDDRSFRDPNNDPDRKSFLGARQLEWVKAGLARSRATFKLIACGNQILSDTHRNESWGVQFRPQRDAFLEWLWERKITGVIFLAGDRHFAELVHKKDPAGRGPDFWELTSSPLANDVFADGPKIPNPSRVASYADGVNFGLLKFDTLADPPRVEMRIVDVTGKSVIRQVVTARRQQ